MVVPAAGLPEAEDRLGPFADGEPLEPLRVTDGREVLFRPRGDRPLQAGEDRCESVVIPPGATGEETPRDLADNARLVLKTYCIDKTSSSPKVCSSVVTFG